MSNTSQTPFAHILRSLRHQHCWTQGDVAEHLGIDKITVYRWEAGITFPVPFYRTRLCELFQISGTELFPHLTGDSTSTNPSPSVAKTECPSPQITPSEEAQGEETLLLQERTLLALEQIRLQRIQTQQHTLECSLILANQLIDLFSPSIDSGERNTAIISLLHEIIQLHHSDLLYSFLQKYTTSGTPALVNP